MFMRTEISPSLEALMRPYFDNNKIDPSACLIEDLRITGSDYLDIIADIENRFTVDLTDFLVGPEPQHVSNGWVGWLVGNRRKPIFRDVSIREIHDYLTANSKDYEGRLR